MAQFKIGDTVKYYYSGDKYLKGVVTKIGLDSNAMIGLEDNMNNVFYNIYHFIHKNLAWRSFGWCECSSVNTHMHHTKIVLTEKAIKDNGNKI